MPALITTRGLGRGAGSGLVTSSGIGRGPSGLVTGIDVTLAEIERAWSAELHDGRPDVLLAHHRAAELLGEVRYVARLWIPEGTEVPAPAAPVDLAGMYVELVAWRQFVSLAASRHAELAPQRYSASLAPPDERSELDP